MVEKFVPKIAPDDVESIFQATADHLGISDEEVMQISRDVMESGTAVFFERRGEARVPVTKSSQDLPKP